MSTYTVTIKNNNNIIASFASTANIDYDNILWWELNKLVKTLKAGFASKEELIKKIESNSSYFYAFKDQETADIVIDLGNNTMNKPLVPLYAFDQVKPENCCIGLRKENDDYYAVYEDFDESFLMSKVSFEDVALLNKDQVTLDEFIKVSDFISELTKEDESDYVLNNQLVLRFNNI